MNASPSPSASMKVHADPTINNSRSTSSDTPLEKKRGKLPKSATDLLKEWIRQHAKHPYPTEEEKIELCVATGLSMTQLCSWMINARRRILPPAQRTQSHSLNTCTEVPQPPLGAPASETNIATLLHQAYLLNDDSDFFQLLSLPSKPPPPPKIEPYCQVLRSQLGFSTRTSFSARNGPGSTLSAHATTAGSTGF